MTERAPSGIEVLSVCLIVLLAGCRMTFTPEAGAAGDAGDGDGDVARTVAVQPAAIKMLRGGAATYRVALGSQPGGTVAVTVASPSAGLAAAPRELEFGPGSWQRAQTVTVHASRDAETAADRPARISHTASGGGYDGVTAVVRVTVVEPDVATLGVTRPVATEAAGRLSFEVWLSRETDRAVRVEYATGDDGATATRGDDYVETSGTLTFPAGSAATRTVTVVVRDDALDEPDELLTLTLSNATAPLASGEATLTVVGTIEDDDPPPRLSVEAARLREGGGSMRFDVRLQPASGRTVTARYATADGTARSGFDYATVAGEIEFPPGTTLRTIAVPILDDDEAEDDETFTLTLTVAAPHGAVLAVPTATGTIEDSGGEPVLQLASLQITGGESPYPEFDPGIRHYRLTCNDGETLGVSARATRGEVNLTLLRENPDDNYTATGAFDDVPIEVTGSDDIAIELNDSVGTTSYVVHCFPAGVSEIRVLEKTAQVSPGLLFVTAGKNMAIVDNNGVPRFHRRHTAPVRNFRRHPNGPVIDGRRVRYSVSRLGATDLLDEDFARIRSVRTVAPLTNTDPHDFLFTGDGNFLFISYHRARHDLRPYGGRANQRVFDSVIQEVTPDGVEVFRWNSWDHREVMNIGNDCTLFITDYAHLNSLHLIDGDIVASFRHCTQVLRIDGATGAIVWKLGGTRPPPEYAAVEYLEIVDDPDSEFCAQHHVTLSASGSLVLYDNGTLCLGARQFEPPFTRAVEYDISSGTHARYVREFRLPAEFGYTPSQGGVSVYGEQNPRWLIAWGPKELGTSTDPPFHVSEVDPRTGTVHLRLQWRSSYRAYREPEDEVSIPLHLP